MNILIDIGHPAHVHLLLYLTRYLSLNNVKLFFTVKDNNLSAQALLNHYHIPFIKIGKRSDKLIGKIINQLKYDFRIAKIIRANKINLGIGSSINLAHVSKITRIKSIVLDDDDDEVQPLFTKFAHPFADTILSPESLLGKRKKKDTIYYSGFHELAYLHPNRFTPDASIISDAGIKEGEKYFILRFNSFKAHHDIGAQGLSRENKRKLIKLLSEYGKIFITTERDIDPEFEQYKIMIPPHKIHSFIYYAAILIGDSQTMTSEAAVLGTPAIRSNSFVGRISYLEELEHKYGLTYGYKPDETEKMFAKIKELLLMPDLKEEWQRRRQKMLAGKIDVTAFLVWFVENYPESQSIMKFNPDYQYRFK